MKKEMERFRELIKEKYAEGREYFVCIGSAGLNSNLVNLLKAFSFFTIFGGENIREIIRQFLHHFKNQSGFSFIK